MTSYDHISSSVTRIDDIDDLKRAIVKLMERTWSRKLLAEFYEKLKREDAWNDF